MSKCPAKSAETNERPNVPQPIRIECKFCGNILNRLETLQGHIMLHHTRGQGHACTFCGFFS